MTETSLESRVRTFVDTLATTERRLSHIETIYHAGTTVVAYCASYDVTDAWTEDIEHYEDVVVPHPQDIGAFLRSNRISPAEANPALLRVLRDTRLERAFADEQKNMCADLFADTMRDYASRQQLAPVELIPRLFDNGNDRRTLIYAFKPVLKAHDTLRKTIRDCLTLTDPAYEHLYAEILHSPTLDPIAETEISLYGERALAQVPRLVRNVLAKGTLNESYAQLVKNLELRASETHSPRVHALLQESARVVNQEYVASVLNYAALHHEPEKILANLFTEAKTRTGKDAPAITRPPQPSMSDTPPVSLLRRASQALFIAPFPASLIAFCAHKLAPGMQFNTTLAGALAAGGLAASYISAVVLDYAADRKDRRFKDAQNVAREKYNAECLKQMPLLLEKSVGPYLREAFSHPHPVYNTYAAQRP